MLVKCIRLRENEKTQASENLEVIREPGVRFRAETSRLNVMPIKVKRVILDVCLSETLSLFTGGTRSFQCPVFLRRSSGNRSK